MWTLEYIGSSRDGCSTPQHQLGTLNSAAAASLATETMSEEAFQGLRQLRSTSSPVRCYPIFVVVETVFRAPELVLLSV